MAILKERVLDTLGKQDLELYLTLVEELAEECGCDIAEIAAAATFLAVGDKPLQVKVQPKAEQLVKQWNTDMTRLFIDAGRSQGVSASDIVGAIANEGNVPGKAIGAIDIYDRFTLVDVPSEFTDQVLEQMRNSRIRSQKANVRVADSRDASENTRKTFEKSHDIFENKRGNFADKSGGDKTPRRKKPDSQNSFSRENTYGDEEMTGRAKKTNVYRETKTGAKTVKPRKLKNGKKKPKWTKEQREHRNKFPKPK